MRSPKLVLVVLLTAGVTTAPAAVAVGAPADEAGQVVTLVTGDRLRVSRGAGGMAVEVRPVAGREHVGFLRDGDRVVPSDALPLIDAGRLDPRLFDLARLPRDRPPALIVTDAGGEVPATGVRALPSVRGAALRPADGFWDWFTRSRASVWLDGVSRPTLDTTAPLIGAPTAWDSGFTGAGVAVGVLDTGVDAEHPDLAGRVVEQADFTGSGPADEVGHGTHVAGIIAGDGTASGGRYRGIAPDATLISGKVCTTFGCPDSAVIAGMEWIAPRAAVVNMSLGGASSDGKDPVSRALNDLTARHGTLFVVAAGNDRSLDQIDPLASVTSPAAADAALAVGSTDRDGATSPFSPRQPRPGDHAVKPDIAAPGADVVSARAPGTPAGDTAPVDEHYATLSGTSMAAPHVAGTAALLRQRHPGWTADRLKPLLVSTAHPTADVFEQGAGRVDAARAVAQDVSASGGLGFGFLRWPHDAPLDRTVTYRNDGAAPVALTLSTDSPRFTASAPSVVVPAHGTASVTVRLDPAGASGRLGARLTGRAPGVVVRTALTAVLEPEAHEVRVTLRGRTGTSASTVVKAVDNATGAAYGVRVVNGVGTARLPVGRYDVTALEVSDANDVTLLARTGVTVDRATTVALDATTGTPVTTTVDRAGAQLVVGELLLVSGTAERNSSLGWFARPGQRVHLVATPGTATVTDHVFSLSYRATLTAPGAAYHLAFLSRGAIPDGRFAVRDRDLARVDSHYHAQGAPTEGLRSDYAFLDDPGANSGIYEAYPHRIPSRRTEFYTASPGVRWQHLAAMFPPDAEDVENTVSYRTYRPGRQETHWNSAPLGPAFGDEGLGFGIRRDGGQLSVGVTLLSGGAPDHFTLPPYSATGTTELFRDGRSLGVSDLPGTGVFEVPEEPGTYTLRSTVTRSVPWSVIGTSADVTWTFHDSGGPAPVLLVRASGDVDEQGRAPAGRLFPLRLVAQHQPGATASRIVSLRVEASSDDGVTWRAAPTTFTSSGVGLALVSHPAAPGFTSLRITARDAAGNSVVQTVVRAYQTR